MGRMKICFARDSVSRPRSSNTRFLLAAAAPAPSGGLGLSAAPPASRLARGDRVLVFDAELGAWRTARVAEVGVQVVVADVGRAAAETGREDGMAEVLDPSWRRHFELMEERGLQGATFTSRRFAFAVTFGAESAGDGTPWSYGTAVPTERRGMGVDDDEDQILFADVLNAVRAECHNLIDELLTKVRHLPPQTLDPTRRRGGEATACTPHEYASLTAPRYARQLTPPTTTWMGGRMHVPVGGPPKARGSGARDFRVGRSPWRYENFGSPPRPRVPGPLHEDERQEPYLAPSMRAGSAHDGEIERGTIKIWNRILQYFCCTRMAMYMRTCTVAHL